MEGEFADGAAGDDDAEAAVVEFLDGAFELVFLAFGEVEHFLGVVQEDGALGLRLAGVDGAAEDADFGILRALDGGVGRAAEDHALDDFGLLEGAAHDLDDADVVDVEIGGVLGQDGEDGFGDHAGEEVLRAGLLGGDDGADGLFEVGLRADVLDFVDDEVCSRVLASRFHSDSEAPRRHTIKNLQCFCLRPLVSLYYVACLETHPYQLLCLS